MIGSHNSYTYLNATNKFFNWFTFLWRTQVKNISEQIKSGVEYFDIRVRHKDNKWQVCHGLVDVNKYYNSLEHILEEFSPYRVRIILERGSAYDKQLFKSTIHSISNKYPNLRFSCIKEGWEIIVDKKDNIKDYTYVPWLSDCSFWDNIKRFNFVSTIKKWAKKHNPKITDKLIEDNMIHFIDYVG